MEAADIKAFMNRDWRLLEEETAAFWAARKAELGPGEAMRVAGILRQQVRCQRPDWPSEEDRRADLECHRRVAAALRRARPRTAR